MIQPSGEIGAEIDGALQGWSDESGIDQQRHTGGVGELGDGRDVEDFEAGIADGFAEQQAGFGTDGGTPGLMVAGRNEGGFDAEARQGVSQQIVRAAI